MATISTVLLNFALTFVLLFRWMNWVWDFGYRGRKPSWLAALTMPDWVEPPTMSDAPFQVPQSGWLQLYQSVTPQPLVGFPFHNEHAAHEEGSLRGSEPNSDAIGANPEYAQSLETLERGDHEANGDVLVDPEPRKGTRKRERDKNWTDEETSVLVKCKRLAFHEKASPFRKHKSSATDWGVISQELRNNPDTSASEKTGNQCRLRWDTLVKSHRIIKERCMQTEKAYAEFTDEEISGLKLATTLSKEWYEVIDVISRKTRSRKRDHPPQGVGDLLNHEDIIGNGADPVSPRIPPTHWGPLSSARAGISPPCSSPLHVSSGLPEPWTSSRKQIAIPGFSSLPGQLRSTLLDLILGRRFLRVTGEIWETEALSRCCRWLSIVQNRSCSDIYDDVSVLVKMGLVRLSANLFNGNLDARYFCVFDKFVKKVIRNNPGCNTHRHFNRLDDTKFLSARDFSVPERIRVLTLDRCRELESVDFRGLRRLRSLLIRLCPVLKMVTGWKFLRELGWLEIDECPSFHDYPDLQNLPSLKEFCFGRYGVSDCPPRSDLGISQCVRLRRLEIIRDELLEASGDLSSLKCLEVLNFSECNALSTITGLSGLHSLTSLELQACFALSSLPDLSHMKELVDLDVRWTGLEGIPGVEKLVSLKTLNCWNSNLKHLPDLHHLPALQKVCLRGTPLIEDDPSSFYFDRAEVLFNCEETRHVDVSDISDTEHNLSDFSSEED